MPLEFLESFQQFRRSGGGGLEIAPRGAFCKNTPVGRGLTIYAQVHPDEYLLLPTTYSEFTNNVPLTPPAIRPLKVGSRWNRPSGG